MSNKDIQEQAQNSCSIQGPDGQKSYIWVDQCIQAETLIVRKGDSNFQLEVMEKFKRIVLIPELSKKSRKLRNRLDLMAWSKHVTTDN